MYNVNKSMQMILLIQLLLSLCVCTNAISEIYRTKLQTDARLLFNHAYNGYIEYAFPGDELRPLSGSGVYNAIDIGNSNNQYNNNVNEYNGIALSLIDSLSTLAVINDTNEFTNAVNYLSSDDQIDMFDLDVRVNVFEFNIRVLGGLISAHLLASDGELNLVIGGYNDTNSLLPLASDLAHRLLRAFDDTTTVFPVAYVNLRHGIHINETRVNCVAGIGTLLMEFSTIAYLINNTSMFELPYRALTTLYNTRSSIDLLGNSIDIRTNTYIDTVSTIGAGVDSYFEYLYKCGILLDDNQLLDMFNNQYTAIQTYLKHIDSNGRQWYISAHSSTGTTSYLQFNALQAFFPGLQSLYGDLQQAQSVVQSFYSIWDINSCLPERVWLHGMSVHQTEKMYSLRPELIESIYYIYRATRDDRYLRMGERIMSDINTYMRTDYGYASIRNVNTMELEDSMPSYLLSETAKYLYLLFSDDHHWLHKNQHKYLFSTEAHIYPISSAMQRWRHKFSTGDIKYNTSKQTNTRTTCNVPAEPQFVSPIDVGWAPAIDPSFELYRSPVVKAVDTCPITKSLTSTVQKSNPIEQQTQLLQFVREMKSNNVDVAIYNDENNQLRTQFTHDQFTIDNTAEKITVYHKPTHSAVISYNVIGNQYYITHASKYDFTPITFNSHQLATYKLYIPVSELFDARNAATANTVVTPLISAHFNHIAHNNDVQSMSTDITSVTCKTASRNTFKAIQATLSTEQLNELGGSIDSMCVQHIEEHAVKPNLSDELLDMMQSDEIDAELILPQAPLLGCEPITSNDELARVKNRIVLILRGKCIFYTKILNYQAAGAAAVIIANNDSQNPWASFPINTMGSTQSITMPVFMLTHAQAQPIYDAINNKVLLARKQSVDQLPSIQQIKLNAKIQRHTTPINQPIPVALINSLSPHPQHGTLQIKHKSDHSIILQTSDAWHVAIDRVTVPDQQQLDTMAVIVRVF